jgi:hypothetical protein
VSPTKVTGRMDLLPTMIDKSMVGLGGRKRERERERERERDVTRIMCGVIRRTGVSDPLRKCGWRLERHCVEGVSQ